LEIGKTEVKMTNLVVKIGKTGCKLRAFHFSRTWSLLCFFEGLSISLRALPKITFSFSASLSLSSEVAKFFRRSSRYSNALSLSAKPLSSSPSEEWSFET